MNTKEEVKQILFDNTTISKDDMVDDANFFDDLGMDSIEIVEFFMELEDKFNICIDDSEMELLTTIGKVMEFLKNKGIE